MKAAIKKAKTAKTLHVPVPAKKCVHFFKCMWNDDCEKAAKKELSAMSSEELEAMGRHYGIELDRRLVKSTLVRQLYEAM